MSNKFTYWILSHKKLAYILGFLILTGVALVSILLMQHHVCDYQRATATWTSAGLIFVIVVGFLTLLGLFATWLKIETFSASMVNYNLLLAQLIDFVNGEKEEDKLKEIYLLCLTPKIGNVSDFDVSEKLKEALARRDNLQLISLDNDQLEQFYLKKLRDFVPANINNVNIFLKKRAQDAQKCIDYLVQHGNVKKDNIKYYDTEKVDPPTFHLLFTKVKGFLFMPFFTKNSKIKMFSVQVSDPTVLKHFDEVFQFYWVNSK